MDQFVAGAALHRLAPPDYISRHRAGKDGASVGMNVTAHQEEKNEETRAGKRRTGDQF